MTDSGKKWRAINGSWEVCKILETLPKPHILSLFFLDSITPQQPLERRKNLRKSQRVILEKITDRNQDAFETDSLTSGWEGLKGGEAVSGQNHSLGYEEEVGGFQIPKKNKLRKGNNTRERKKQQTPESMGNKREEQEASYSQEFKKDGASNNTELSGTLADWIKSTGSQGWELDIQSYWAGCWLRKKAHQKLPGFSILRHQKQGRWGCTTLS